jgi:NADPH-dependent F420 reductase
MDQAIAILGGTGKEGQGLALRWARSGRRVIAGSRLEEKGRRVAAELNGELGSNRVEGATNRDAARAAEVIVSTLPYDGHVQTLAELKAELAGKLLITATLRWPIDLSGASWPVSAAEELDRELAGAVPVVAAFQTVSAGTLRDPERSEDVLVFGDDAGRRSAAVALVDETGLRGIEAGPLKLARVGEALTGLLIRVNKIHRVHSTGIRITGLPEKSGR